MTMEELAKKLGYKSKVSIYNIEKGRANLPTAKIIELADALCTTPAKLLGIESAADSKIDVQVRFNRLPDEAKDRILTYLAFIEYQYHNE